MIGGNDDNVIRGFGDEWSRYDQSRLSEAEAERLFEAYFKIFPWDKLPPKPVGFDLGCGSGRWARLVAPRVGILHLIDPSDALDVARRNLEGFSNCVFHRARVEDIPIAIESCDFGYCLGVLHHIPDTEAGMRKCVARLKPGAPFLVYLYYRFDNRPAWFRAVWKLSDVFRRFISRLPHSLRNAAAFIIALGLYLPLAGFARLLERLGFGVANLPLSQYRSLSFYTMRTDALDRFGTRVEKRFTKSEVFAMMERCGLRDISFSDEAFWTAVGYRR